MKPQFKTSLLRLSSAFQSASTTALRAATSPHHVLSLYKTRIQRRNPAATDYFDSHAAVSALKSSSRLPSSSATTIIPHLHAFFLKSNLLSNIYVSTALLHAHALSSLANARRLFDEIPNPNTVTQNTMITCYSNYRDINSARTLFNAMPDKDLASWSAMIGTYVNNGYPSQGLTLFREMIDHKLLKPDQLLLVTLLTGCASSGSLGLLGRSVHAYCVKDGMEINEQLGTSLIDMYNKSGCLRSAFQVFEMVSDRTVMHWSAMICGLALHGHGEDAVAFFEEMRKEGVKPNAITFTGVLNACCHAGLVGKGQRYFGVMVEEFGCEPSIHHYGCLVELLAKAGRLEDAYNVIKSMKIEPNIVVWSSFLGACRKHKNFEIAEGVLERVLQMSDPDKDGGVFSLISDLYALGGKWNDVERVRKLMDTKYVKKNRGYCFIQLEGSRNSAS